MSVIVSLKVLSTVAVVAGRTKGNDANCMLEDTSSELLLQTWTEISSN